MVVLHRSTLSLRLSGQARKRDTKGRKDLIPSDPFSIESYNMLKVYYTTRKNHYFHAIRILEKQQTHTYNLSFVQYPSRF